MRLIVLACILCIVANDCSKVTGSFCKKLTETTKQRNCEKNPLWISSNFNGISGQKGEQGDPGDDGFFPNINFTIVKELMENELNKYNILRPNININNLCLEGLLYENQCFILRFIRGVTKVNASEAQRICRSHNSILAEITSTKMLDRVIEYMSNFVDLSRNTTLKYINAWVGMTFQPVDNPNNFIKLSNGTNITLSGWRSKFPKVGSEYAERTRLAVIMRRTNNTGNPLSNSGLYNRRPAKSEKGENVVPLCSYHL